MPNETWGVDKYKTICYNINMFVRIKTTPNSPRKSVQIVQSIRKGDKVVQKIVRYVGIAMDEQELEKLKLLAESIKIKLEAGNQELLFSPEELARLNRSEGTEGSDNDYKVNLKDLLEEQRVVSGIHDIYGRLFDELGYAKVIKNPKRYKSVVEIYKNIVLARIANPRSKMASIDMLEEDFGISINLDKVYRMMDKIDTEAIERLNEITYSNTMDLFNQKIDIIFFDCTTIYFEAFEEDDLRRTGYSKDLKFNQPQILLALMVTKEGLPIGYKVFEGDKYEGHTLVPMIKEIEKKHKMNKVIIVSDAGMFGRNNLEELENLEGKGIEYIVGARLRNMPEDIKEEILDISKYQEIGDGYKVLRLRYRGKDLIISYSEKRAKKDAQDRLKAIEAIQKKLSKNKSPNNYLSNYGYKRYLKVSNKIKVEIDEEKLLNDSRWDGLHGVI